MLETPSIAVIHPGGNDRYEIREAPIGQGGMGVVYRAYDTVTRRHVALKTLTGSVDAAALEMFEREWSVLARISHPNIIDILDKGTFEQDGQIRPYFVMPLLRGATLDQLIKHSSERLTVEGVVDIISQVCRGLQAAHDQNLVHRDLKPSNIFVMDDDTIKIIDFGIAHLADTRSVTGMKGTLQYMAPEQLEMKPPTPLSDIFSLGVVCYEALTGRRPFARKTDSEVVDAIRTYVPPPATEVNNAVNQMISRTVHKAMAKQSWHRFTNAREFGDTLKRALRNEPIERFDKSKIQGRLDRIRKAQSEGDYQFAAEILTELESEGHIDPDMSVLRLQIDQTVRQRNIRQLLENARTRIEEDELPLALQKIQSVLEIDPLNADALALKGQVERQRSERQIENWFRLVRQHIDNQDYGQARQGIGEILKINSSETRARELLATIDRTEAELIKAQEEKQKLYDAALALYRKGEISTALGKLERLLEINRTGPRSPNPERDAQYQSLYNQVRSEHDAVRNAYTEARRHLLEKNFAKAREICDESLAKHPDDHLFQALKLEIHEAQRQQQSATVAEINRRVEAEPDLDKKFSILTDAVEKHPDERVFQASLDLVRERRDLINSIVTRARQHEDRGQFADAAGQWDILRNIYPKYPGLDFELERISRRREDQSRNDNKARWVEQIDRHLDLGDYTKAQELLNQANLELPGDAELEQLGGVVQTGLRRNVEASALVVSGQTLIAQSRFEEGLDHLRQAERLDDRNPAIRAALMSAIVKRARELMLADWKSAEPLVIEATELDSSDPVVRGLSTLIDDYKKQEAVNRIVVEARNLQAGGDMQGALRRVESGLNTYPNELRLSQLYNTLRSATSESRRKETLAPTGPKAVLQPPPAPKLPASPPAAPNPGPPRASTAPPPAENAKDLELPPTVKTTILPSVVLPAASVEPRPPGPLKPGKGIPARPEAPPPVIVPGPRPPSPASPNRSRLIWGAGAAAIVVIAAALFFRSNQPPVVTETKPALLSSVPLKFSSNVAGAHYVLDGQPVTDLDKATVAPGSHKAEATLEGYTSDFKDFSVGKNRPETVVLAFNLQPLLPELRVSSDLKSGKYILDKGTPADLQDGSLVRESIAAGPHTLAILDGTRPIFSFGFTAEPKEPVKLTEALGSKTSPGLIVSSLGSSAHIYSTPGLKGGLDGQPLVPIPAEGLAVPLSANQAARFIVDDGKSKPRTVPIEFSPLPILSVFLSGAAERLPLVINANVPDATVLINGHPLTRPMAAGTRTVLLPPGTYKFKVVHEGYQDVSEQTVTIKSGDTNLQPLTFQLAEVVQAATLIVDNAPSGAEVLVDGTRAGLATGTSSAFKEIAPGTHLIAVRKTNYEDFRQTLDFKNNAQVHLNAAGMKGPGVVNIKVVPQNAVIMYHRDGDAASVTVENNHSLDLRAGTYEFSAEAPNHFPKKDLITISSGKVYDVSWTLPARVIANTVRPGGPQPDDVFVNGPAWTVTPSQYWLHAGKGISFLKRSEGLHAFNLVNPKDGKDIVGLKMRKIVFVVDYSGPDNQVLYTLDAHNLSRRATINGSAQENFKTESGIGGKILGIIVEVSPSTIVVKNSGGRVLDTYKRTGNPGKLGFVDEVAVAPFR